MKPGFANKNTGRPGVRIGFFLMAFLISGCTSDSPEPALEPEPAPEPQAMSEALTFSQTVQTVGTGAPTVQCPADQVNSQTLTWTIAAPEGNVSGVGVTELTVAVSGAVTVNDVDLFVSGPAGSTSATGSTAQESVTLGGTQPVGDYQIEVRGCSGVGAVTVTGSGTLHWTA